MRQAQSVLEQAANIKDIAKCGKDPPGRAAATGGDLHHRAPPVAGPGCDRVIKRTPQMPLILQENFTVKLLEICAPANRLCGHGRTVPRRRAGICCAI